jgi:hypothetical protein
MLHAARALTLVVALGALSAGAAQAQVQPQGAAGSDILTLNVYGGGYAPTSAVALDTDFDDSGTVGAAATVWLHRYVGIRANALYAQTEAPIGAPAPLGGESPDVWAYSGDVVVRLPLSAGDGPTWFPYLVGGLGGKTYDFELNDTETDFAGNFGGGIEYRFNRVGLQAEVRDIISSFERFGIDETQHDVVWTAGITMSF